MAGRCAGVVAGALLLAGLAAPAAAGPRAVRWRHLSTTTGDLQPPNGGDQQTSSAVADFDGDGVSDFVVTERTKAPSVVLYRRAKTGWDRFVVDATPQHIEAGTEAFDIDGDGDQDLLVGGDWMSSLVWWYENPSPRLVPGTPWARHTVKDWGATKHHDQLFGDFDGDGRAELAFWNQGGRALYVCEIPEKPAAADRWPCSTIYTWSDDSEMLQRQTKPYPGFKGVNEHEGLAAVDVDGDGKVDLVGGGRWFKHRGGTTYDANIVDASYPFTRAVAGQLVEGGRPEVVLTVGDGWAPLMLYEWQKGTWVPKVILPEVDCTHSIRLVDFDRDGHLDIWLAEMRLDGGNPDAKNQVLFGDGKGGFEPVTISEGYGLHESEIADLDGDGDLDVLGKPYNWDAPRLDVWINEGPAEPAADGPRVPFAHRVVDEKGPRDPWTKVLGDLDGDGDADVVLGGTVWFENPGGLAARPEGRWVRHVVAEHPTHDVELADLDGDGRLDVVTRDQTEWAKAGHTIHVFLQPSSGPWTESVLSCPEGEGLATADLDRDGDPDIVVAGVWFENVRGAGGVVFAPRPFARSEGSASVAVGDLNGDSRPDVVAAPAERAGQRGRVVWFESPPDPRADGWREHVIAADIERVLHSLAVADVDGDGRMDLVLAEMHQGEDPDEVAILFNDGAGEGWERQVVATTGSHTLRAADLDADGDVDLFGAN